MRQPYRILTLMVFVILSTSAPAADDPGNPYAEPENPGLPPSNMELDLSRTAVVITDPQIDFLSEDGVTWEVLDDQTSQDFATPTERKTEITPIALRNLPRDSR